MINIDYIMSLLDCNQNADAQADGIKMANGIQNFNVFLQPCNKNYNKNVWDNCAIILSERTDQELTPYLNELMEWLRDMNWPGAYCILARLQKYANEPSFIHAYSSCLKCARALEDEVWENNLQMIRGPSASADQ